MLVSSVVRLPNIGGYGVGLDVHPFLRQRIIELNEKGISRARIRKIVGCRNTVICFVLGKRIERMEKTPHPSKDGDVGKCPICGGNVVIPCLKCYLIGVNGGNGTRTAKEAREGPSNVS